MWEASKRRPQNDYIPESMGQFPDEEKQAARDTCELDATVQLGWVPHGSITAGGQKAYDYLADVYYFVKPVA